MIDTDGSAISLRNVGTGMIENSLFMNNFVFRECDDRFRGGAIYMDNSAF